MIIVPLLQRTSVFEDPESFKGDTLRCVIACPAKSGNMNYPIGYNYEMLKLFSESIGKVSDISLGDPGQLDSLWGGEIDIVVVPYSDSLVDDQNYLASIPLRDSSSWVLRGNRHPELKSMNLWLSSSFTTQEYKDLVSRFTPSYEPYSRARSGRKYTNASPYDGLLKKYAATIGWDWRMLAALVWQESKFRIEVRSGRGALGLMQLMPVTASHYEIDSLLDPEENIETASRYLLRLQRMFRANAADSRELMKFTLAAYNAGEGRIRDCINYAASIGKPNSRWSDIVAIIPDMREDSILESDTVKLGKFKGYETISYIESMTALYEAFCVIAPGQSSQGLRETRKDTAAVEMPLSENRKEGQQQEPAAD